MRETLYEIGGIKVLIITSDRIHEGLSKFCPLGTGTPYYTIKITEAESQQELFDLYHSTDLGDDTPFDLEGNKYYYRRGTKAYFIFNNYCFGKNDLKNHCAEYLIHGHSNIRRLFHMTILDTISLSIPEINRIVFHGAAIRYKDSAVLLVGRSGNGKSTISHRLTETDAIEKISDDTFIVHIEDDEILLYPLNTGEGYSHEMADTLLKTGDYSKLQSVKEKTYIYNHSIDLKPLGVKYCFVLNRTVSDAENTTNIQGLTNNQLLSKIIDSQTNIASPHLIKKYSLYTTFSELVEGFSLRFVNDCDTNLVLQNMSMR